jgi:hypothetical protein
MADTLRDPKGREVPRSLIKDIDLLRDEMVQRLVTQALDLEARLAAFRELCVDELAAFVELSAAKYGVHVGGHKGNVQLLSYDGRWKIQRAIQDQIVFDERLQIAKELIDECVKEWSGGTRPEIRTLVSHAFQVDRAGKISTERVLGLRRLDIDDERWLRAMAAISDSVQIASSKAYVRFYRRVGDTDKWQQVGLDLSSAEQREAQS